MTVDELKALADTGKIGDRELLEEILILAGFEKVA
jgi:hypothetical protein